MRCKEIIKFLDDWAPPGIAWERDNVGLQVGSPEAEISNILLCLELKTEILNEALLRKCNLIITHHPLIFYGIKKLNLASDPNAQLLSTLIKNDITVLSYHTNLDFTKDGVSYQLAKILGLKNIRPLVPLESSQSKLVVFVPREAVDPVMAALFAAGAGTIGNYSRCSFSSTGEGTFYGSSETNPAYGEKETFEKVDETRLEVVVENWKISNVVSALKSAHPYEEPAYDIFPLKISHLTYGAGAIGDFEQPMFDDFFLKHLQNSLQLKNFRYSKGKSSTIGKVALCGGSGVEYLHTAIAQKADTFITADIKYHFFQDAEGKILLVDAGHFETEIIVLPEIQRKLSEQFPELASCISITDYSSNPVKFYINNEGQIV